MEWLDFLVQNWHVKVVAITLIVAAWIDGKELRVPNWLTFSMVLSGLAYCTISGGFQGLGNGLLGMVVGLLTLLPLYAVGGMGAGDVKLMAGIGAWLGPMITLYAFAVSAVLGAIMAVLMVTYRKGWSTYYKNTMMILFEWVQIRNPSELYARASERKPRMTLLPYGIPICIGSIAYFCYAGLI